jgi:hypothetical protein
MQGARWLLTIYFILPEIGFLPTSSYPLYASTDRIYGLGTMRSCFPLRVEFHLPHLGRHVKPKFRAIRVRSQAHKGSEITNTLKIRGEITPTAALVRWHEAEIFGNKNYVISVDW